MPYIKQSINGDTVNVVAFEKRLGLGRSLDNDVVIDDPTVSQSHAKIIFEQGSWKLIDCDSTNGVLIDGKKQSQILLQDGVTFTIGTQAFEFCITEPSGLDKTLRIKKSWIPGVYYTE